MTNKQEPVHICSRPRAMPARSVAGHGGFSSHPRGRPARRVSDLVAVLLVLAVALAGAPDAAAQATDKPLFDRVTDRARALAGKPYASEDNDEVPEVLANLSYEQYRDIRFNKNQALWKDKTLFSVELFHPGFLYLHPVVLHEVIDGKVTTVPYDASLFDYGKNENLQGGLDRKLGFAGFRVHYPINRKEYQDEVIAFLGASYFRMVGRGQAYGLSSRGLAVNTAVPEGEEFPRFTEFWLVRPAPDATTMTFYALLDSKSVTGAYRFDLTPGAHTVLGVEARLFAREDVKKLGVAPLTSMFMYGENSVRHYDDYRPEVHDSDGLLMHTGSGGEWIWRPLSNGRNLEVSTLLDQNPRGFGLVQRDRDFGHYQDMEARYEIRPSEWVSPRGDWGKGAVELIEIPSEEETNDNIVSFWVPEEPFNAGQERTFSYQLRTFGASLAVEQHATVSRTRIGWGAIPGAQKKPPRSLRQFIVDFSGGELDGLDASQPVKPELSVSGGEARDVTASRLPDGQGWRIAFKLKPQEDRSTVMRLFLSLRGDRLSETWNYVWNPNLIQ